MDLVFGIIIGMLFGLLVGGAVFVGYLRRQIAGDVAPKLLRIQMRLDSLEAALNLTIAARYEELSGRLSDAPRTREGISGTPTFQAPPGPDFGDEDEDDS